MAEPTQEERIAQLEAELAESKQTSASLRSEAAERRVSRNEALKREHVLSNVLQAHKIDFNVSEFDTSGIEINDGRAVGEVAYKVPNKGRPGTSTPPTKKSAGSGGGQSGLTMDDVSTMNRYQIIERWEEVEKALKGGA